MHIVVVGAGPAAHRLVAALRGHGHRGRVTVLGAEPHPPYLRPLLGSVLDGRLPAEALTLPAPDADLRTGVSVTSVDRPRRLVHTDDGRAYAYDVLVLATGAGPRQPPPYEPAVGGEDGTADDPPVRVSAVHTLDDCRAGPAGLGTGPGSVVVAGAGVLGVETSVALRENGHSVTLVHRGPFPMENRLDETAGLLLAERLRQLGVDVLTDRSVSGYGRGLVTLDHGERIPADHMLLCTGVVPETGLARRAGLTVRDGIVVDERLCTSDPRIHAIGDCAQQAGAVPGSVATAWEQADALAALLTGAPGAAVRAGRARPVLRLRSRSVELAVFGSPGDPDSGGAGIETVTFKDASGGRYAKLSLSEGRVRAGVLLGLPRAASVIAQLYDRRAPLPSDRLSLLLGAPPITGDRAAAPPDDALICDCNNVSRAALRTAWRGGARDLYALVAATRATTGCGGCADDVRAWCAQARTGTGGDDGPAGAELCVPTTAGGGVR